MKNLITFCVIFLTTTLMLTSCGSLSIEKRHHTKGYYLSHNNIKSSNKTVKIDNIENSETASRNLKEENNTATIRTEENAVSTSAMAVTDVVEISSIEEESTTETTSNVTETKKTRTNLKASKELVPSSIKKTATKFKNVYSDSKSKYAPASGDGYSLLWIIIIVLLVLWLLGYLGGFGGSSALIHLLLVIALILLILWLLRII